MSNEIVSWPEIPVRNMDRARAFYERVMELEIVDLPVGNEIYACFSNRAVDGYTGALVQYDFTDPGKTGALVYLDSNGDLPGMLSRIRAAGGNIVKDEQEIAPGFGSFALFEDTEGNLLGLIGS